MSGGAKRQRGRTLQAEEIAAAAADQGAEFVAYMTWGYPTGSSGSVCHGSNMKAGCFPPELTKCDPGGDPACTAPACETRPDYPAMVGSFECQVRKTPIWPRSWANLSFL